MPEEMDLIKINTIKRYVKEVKKMRISKTAVNETRIRVNDLLKKALSEAEISSKSDKRNTIMPRDLVPALEASMGKRKLNQQEIFNSIKKLNPLDIGELSKLITNHIEKEKKSNNE